MPTDTITPTLVINKLTKAQYETIPNPSDTELYLVPDDDLREHRSYYTTGTATVDGETVDVDIMYEGVAPEGSVETDAVWTITTIVATLGGSIVSTTVDTNQIWDFPTPTPVVPVIGTTPPICYPTTASEVKTTSMVVKSSVSDNGRILTENGFVYNTSGNPTISDTKVICDLGVGFFEKKLENLTMNTEYHIKSYGQNASGLVYGSELVQRTVNNPIPVEYQLVEYLQSSGVQCIDTLVRVSNSLKWEYDYMFLGNGQDQNGASLSSSERFVIANLSHLYIGMGNGTETSINVLNDRHKFTLDPRNDRYGVDDDFYPFASSLGSISYNVYLFARNTQGSISKWSVGRCYNSKFYFSDELIRDMYPVYRIADNKPGMYDIVNNVFYTNQCTGEFAVGPDKEWDE